MSKNLRKLSKKADVLFKKSIRKAGKCLRCGHKDRTLVAHHIISCRYGNTRFNRSNVICICVNCHFWVHNWPEQAKDFYKEILGASGYETLHQLALAAPIKQNYEDLIGRLKD